MKKQFTFPRDFLWGSATSAYQVEGDIDTCDWALEAQNEKVPFCGKAADHFFRYEEDFDMAQSLGFNAHRLSIEWSRIEPKEGEIDEFAIEYYSSVIRSLKARGFYVSLTIWHFTLPTWVYKKGGFANEEVIDHFANFAYMIVERFNDLVDDFTTINEPMVYVSNGYIRGNWPPFEQTNFKHFKVHKNLIKAHILSYTRIKKNFPDVKIGIVKDNIFFEGKNVFTKLAAKLADWFWNHRFLKATEGSFDFIGLNYYFHTVIGEDKKPPFTDFGWSIYPRGIYKMLKDLSRYNVPLYITENGLADRSDQKRAQFIVDHLKEVHRALREEVDVRGYYHWSLLDNFEWAEGFEKRFGLIEVDYDTMERKIRESAFTYKKICEDNGF